MNRKNQFNTGVILQARTGSKRLPEKMIIPFSRDKSILHLILEKIKETLPRSIRFVLATTDNPADDKIVNIADHYEIDIFRGAEENVLLRFVKAAEKFNIHRIIRVCGDNPLFDIEGTLDILNEDPDGEFDYVSYKMKDGRPTILSHLGFWGEVVRLDALKNVQKLTHEKQYLEHVTNYIYTHFENFRIKLIETPDYIGNREDIRLTVDTQVDFNLNRELYEQLIRENIPTGPSQIVNFIDLHPDLKESMKTQITLNKK